MEANDHASTKSGDRNVEPNISSTLSGSSTISDVFSFADNPRTKIYLSLGIICSVFNGMVSSASTKFFCNFFTELINTFF